ncbi:MAG TPA: ABC transporter ATP-binding protein [Candidatus Saccharimonadales bacterium]|nr:ABC transporter ATP-binding protein [Candidatus Saccharimonadales bacterium]
MTETAQNPPRVATPSGVALVEVRAVTKSFGPHEVLKRLSLEIASGEFLTLLGESGSGKTTLLRLIAGFEPPTSGEIWMSQIRLDTLPAHERPVNTVFQQYALFPHLNVRENVAYGLRVKNTPANEIPARVDQALGMVKMSEYAGSRPAKLSGGQQQRIALARALVNRPQLLLLDEPLSALDANLRKQMQSELKVLQREVGITFLFVTHDQEEAMALSDRVALLRNGALEQVGSPREMYMHPATAYAAQFIGQTNLLRASVVDGVATCGALRWPTSSANPATTFSLRPEAIELATNRSANSDSHDAVRFTAAIRQQIYSGSSELLEVDCGASQLVRIRVPACGPLAGQQNFSFNPADAIPVRDDPE